MARRPRNLDGPDPGRWRLHSAVAIAVVGIIALVDLTAAPRLESAAADLTARREVSAAQPASDAARRWDDGAAIRFLIDPDGAPEGAVEAVERAAATWQATGVDVEFVSEGLTDQGGLVADLVNTVSWVETDEPTARFVARTVVHWFDDRPDTIVGFDMVFNRDHPFAVGEADDAWDVETVALHEFGHVLGLGHADADRVVRVMRPRIEAGELDHTLSLADLRVLQGRYGDSVHIPSGGLFRPQDDGVRVVEASAAATDDAVAAGEARGLFDRPAVSSASPAGEPPSEVIVIVGDGLFS